MNYLAHIYLSGEDEKTLVGNFIGDYVKGKNFEKYPDKIQVGILLHRQIDTFTDMHPKFIEAKRKLRDDFGLYSGIIVDFFYDHFLAANWNVYSDVTLRSFSKRAHAILLSNFLNLPARVQGFLPFLIQNRRLESYATVDGIIQSIEIMSKYTSLPTKSEIARHNLIQHYDFLFGSFIDFMEDMIAFVTSYHQIIIQKPDAV
jgi:acyl carrier protein phosphodiesterase